MFQKAMRRKDSKDQKKPSHALRASYKPEAITLVESDSFALAGYATENYLIGSAIVKFIFALAFLWNLLGWKSTPVGLAVTGLCVPISTMIITRKRAAKRRLAATRDKKTEVVMEALHALRQIKFSALELQWQQHIEEFRLEEMKELRMNFTASNLHLMWNILAPLVIAAASIVTFTYTTAGPMTPSIVFPMMKVLPLFRELTTITNVLQDYWSARLSCSRIDDYLREAEQTNILGACSSGDVVFREASIRWPANDEASDEKSSTSHRFSLNALNLRFPAGELSVISGKTGSGKSLLLAAIIGEVDLLGGSIHSPAMAESYPVGFVSQTPWLQNTTIKSNILFGAPFVQERYDKVIVASALQPDIAALAQGDETLIGPKGIKLSGGQRARLALARALYSSAQLLVLDDILAALDSHVAKEIFDALTGDLAEGRTRILVTHQVSLCLPRTKYIAVIDGNTTSYSGAPENTEEWTEVAQTGTVEEPRMSPPLEAQATVEKVSTVPKSNAVATKVERVDPRTSLKVYKDYFKAAGGPQFTVIYALGLIAKRLLGALPNWLVGRINSTRPESASNQHTKNSPVIPIPSFGSQHYLYLYLSSCLLRVLLEIALNTHTFSGSLVASKILFHEMTRRVLRMPLLWLDTTPIGDMSRRFIVYSQLVDEDLLNLLSSFAGCGIEFAIIVAIGLHTSIYSGFLTVILLLWCTQVGRDYLQARSTVKRADVQPSSDIIEHFESSTDGVSTLRAFRRVPDAEKEMHQHLDRFATARRHVWMFNRWVGLQMSLIGILFTAGTGVLLLSSKSFIDAPLVGFSLTFSMGFSSWIYQSVEFFGIMEAYMDAARAVLSYAKLETEEQGGIAASEDWPSAGKVEVKGLNVAYAPDLPLVLKNVSFTVAAGKRTGIVGRTGAGKSSIMLALLRLIEPLCGSILIDNVDIATVKLKDLRSRIAFIPQNPSLFSGIVRSNLDCFNQIPEAKLKEALSRVKLLAKEDDEKSGLFTLDSPISARGMNVSQGQRQLLCLARVLLLKPMIMILDEATSAVDNEIDLLVQETIRKEFTGTLIVVAHRLRTIVGFDQVMVMSEGKIVETGKPSELLEKKGMFYNLVEGSQDKEFLTSTIANLVPGVA